MLCETAEDEQCILCTDDEFNMMPCLDVVKAKGTACRLQLTIRDVIWRGPLSLCALSYVYISQHKKIQ